MNQIYLKRINSFYDWMKKEQLEYTLITSPANIYYFTGFYTNPHERFMGLFLTSNEEPVLILPELDRLQAVDKCFLKNIFGYSDSVGPDQIIKDNITAGQDFVLGIEEEAVSFKKALWLKELLRFYGTTDIESGLMELRIIKDKTELKYLKEAAEWADKAIEFGVNATRAGKSELEIIAEIEYKIKLSGIEKMSFDTMVLTGLKSALPHGKPGNNLISEGDFVLFDLGVIVNGYCSDISRTIAVGKPSLKQQEIYNTVLMAEQLAINAVKPNVPLKEIDLTARNHINEFGYGEYFIHRTGHGLGLMLHELPSIHENNPDRLKEGMVFTIEPGIYIPEIGGVRIEDDVYVTATGVEVLTSFTKELIIK